MVRYFYLLLIAFLLSGSIAQAQQKTDLPPDLDAYINKALKTFEVPGAAVAIVHHGKVVMAKGFGIKKLNEPAKVDEHTLFAIASNTKVFTATALTMLAEEGKLKLDDPVINYLPWFRLSDPWVTSQITVRDLLVHHSGIPAYAEDVLLFPPSDYSRKELLMKLKTVPLVRGFRTTYAYDNILFVAAGEVVKAASGMEWEDFIQTRIFNKIGMNESVSRWSSFKNKSNISGGHLRVQGNLKEAKQVMEQAIGDSGDAAGGIASNATDMAKWLITQLDSGKAANGERIYKSSATNDLWKIVAQMSNDKMPADLIAAQTDFKGYALGLRVYNYGKYKVIGHGGKLDGFVSQVAIVPKLNLGIAVLTNQESTSAYWSIIYQVLDHYMQNKPTDWISGYKKIADQSLAKTKEEFQKAIIIPQSGTKPSLPVEKYLGTYHDDLYGDITLDKEADKIILRFTRTPQHVAEVEHFQYDTFLARFQNPDLRTDSYVTFTLNPDGTVSELKLKIIDPDSDISFEGLSFKKTKK